MHSSFKNNQSFVSSPAHQANAGFAGAGRLKKNSWSDL
jgi:hypothetical protein